MRNSVRSRLVPHAIVTASDAHARARARNLLLADQSRRTTWMKNSENLHCSSRTESNVHELIHNCTHFYREWNIVCCSRPVGDGCAIALRYCVFVLKRACQCPSSACLMTAYIESHRHGPRWARATGQRMCIFMYL